MVCDMVCDPRGPPLPRGDPQGDPWWDPRGPPRTSEDPWWDPRGPPRTPEGTPADPRGPPMLPVEMVCKTVCAPRGPPRPPEDPRGDPREPPRTPEGTPGRTPRLPVKTVCGQLQNEECKKTPGCIKVKGQGCKGTYENGADCEAIPKKKWCRKAGCALKVEDAGPVAQTQ